MFVLQGRPLYDNSADEQLFVIPAEWDPIVRANERGLNVLIVGARGVGKTTLLHQLGLTLRRRDEHPVFVDATALHDPAELAIRLRDAIVGRPSVISGAAAGLAAGASRAYYETLQSLAEASPSIVLVDGSSSADAIFGVFGRMRDTVWQLPHTWIVAIDEDDRATALKPPADAFFDSVITMKPVPTNDLAGLLSRRVPEATPQTLARVAALANGNPRAAIRALGHAEIHDSDPGADLTERSVLLERAATLGRPHGMLMAELLDRGATSPSDEGLQRSLGVSRARLTTLLRELLDNELVITDTERPDGPGRPRTVYRPAVSVE